jgi:cell division protein FtsQ
MDAEAFPQEVVADDEPRYLRRQKPLEIKRRKFGRTAWRGYLRVAAWAGLSLAAAGAAYAMGDFLFTSPEMRLIHPEQIQVSANPGGQLRFVSAASVRAAFVADRNHSVLRVPLGERRRQIEALPWVSQAVVRRALPNRIGVEITERAPIAFLREGSEMNLVDAQGMILARPLQGNFHFPVVTGISAEMPIDDRERRMQLFADFSRQVDAAQPGAMDHVNDVDLSDLSDLRATISGLPGPAAAIAADAPVLVHFGEGSFEEKYRSLIGNYAQWRAAVGRVDSIDLRFNREAVVNPDSTATPPQQVAQQRSPATAQGSPVRKNAAKKARSGQAR